MLDHSAGEPSCRDIPAGENPDQPQLHPWQRYLGQANAKDCQEVMTTEYQRLNFGPYLP